MTPVATEASRSAADPRPVVVADADGRHLLAGGSCVSCGHALARVAPRCSRCRGRVQPARFGPEGTIWATTVVHIPAEPGGDVPYAIAYVDLDAGPRLLLRLDADSGRAAVGDRVRLTAPTAAGNATGMLIR